MEALKLSSNVSEHFNPFHTILAAGHALHVTSKERSSVEVQEQLEEPPDVSVTGEDMSSQNPLMNGMSSNKPSKSPEPQDEGPRIQAFAKLEYADGVSYITTYQVEIGRDTDAERLAKQKEYGNRPYPEARPHKDGSSSGNAHRISRVRKHRRSGNMASSVVSESGGIMGPGLRGSGRMSRSKTSFSASSSNYSASRRSSVPFMSSGERFSDYPLEEQYDGSCPVDPIAHLPSPEGCPLIKIHPPMTLEGAANGYRGISRRHVKIAYNFEKRLFEMEVIGMNGAFVDEEHFKAGEVKELTNGCYIQIGNINMRFLLPDVALGETGAEGTADSDLMSFDFEDGRDEDMPTVERSESTAESEADIDENLAPAPNSEAYPVPKFTRPSIIKDKDYILTRPRMITQDEDEPQSQEEADDEIEDDEEDIPEPQKRRREKTRKFSDKPKTKIKLKVKPTSTPQPTPEVPKRKGPGRPPKNGLMSKREQALLVRQAKEAAKAEAMKNGTIKPGKVKEGKSGNTENIQTPMSEVKTEKRKYTKRKKPKGQLEGQIGESSTVRETIESTDQLPAEQMSQADTQPKQPKTPKAIKPPKSPSPVWDESKLTPEQLAKPSQSYVVLIHEALSECPTGAMSLPKIYRAIERRYPYFKLRVQTIGWQSSVRHNLSQHPAFVKIEKDGKGWMWGLDPTVSIEKERKRRPTPPPSMPVQGYPPPHPQQYPHPYGYAGYPPNGYPPPGYPPYGMTPSMQPGPGQYLPHFLQSGNPQALNGFSYPLFPSMATGNSTYQSPYQPTPQSQQLLNSAHHPTSQQPSPNSSDANRPGSQDVNKSKLELEVHEQAKAVIKTEDVTSTMPSDALSRPIDDLSHPPSSSRALPVPQPQSLIPLPPASSSVRSTGLDSISNLGQDVLGAVGRFKKTLLQSMSNNPDAEQIITSAINRTLGIKPVTAEPNGVEFPEEKPIMAALDDILEAIKAKKESQEAAKAQQAAIALASHSPHARLEHLDRNDTQALPFLSQESTQAPLSNSKEDAHTPSSVTENGVRKRDAEIKREQDEGEDDESARGAKRGLEEEDGEDGQITMSKKRLAA